MELIGLSVSIIIGFVLSGLMLGIPYIVGAKSLDYPEKCSAYECGFDPFDDARNQFDIKFYLVAILFLIFDLEVSFLFPWSVQLGEIGYLGFWSMIGFLTVLTIGFYYEWMKGALDWV